MARGWADLGSFPDCSQEAGVEAGVKAEPGSHPGRSVQFAWHLSRRHLERALHGGLIHRLRPGRTSGGWDQGRPRSGCGAERRAEARASAQCELADVTEQTLNNPGHQLTQQGGCTHHPMANPRATLPRPKPSLSPCSRVFHRTLSEVPNVPTFFF